MYLKKLSLVNFKNFESFDYEPCQRINCFIGDNGAGKTNLLDSIHYLSFCKSFINSIDKLHIQTGKDFFIIDGQYQRHESQEIIYCGVQTGKNKSFRKNGTEYAKLSDHIGFIPLVYSTPTDNILIYGGSDLRRKFVDSIISQFDKSYLNNLINYNKALEQRNYLLKSVDNMKQIDSESFEIWDMKLAEYGSIIHTKRSQFKNEIIEIFQKFYDIVSGSKEKVDLIYDSQLNESELLGLLKNNLRRDIFSGYTSTGVHKDDFEFVMSGMSLKKYASQGQQKSYIISLKFAQFEYIKKNVNLAPILLLDDIFDKLDKKRVVKITDLVSDNGFGQIFFTDTSYTRMPDILKSRSSKSKILNLSTNEIIEN